MVVRKSGQGGEYGQSGLRPPGSYRTCSSKDAPTNMRPYPFPVVGAEELALVWPAGSQALA